MDNSKFINYYIEILISTLNDALIKNVSYQANSKISEEIISDLETKIEQSIDHIRKLETTIQEQKNVIAQLNEEISQTSQIKSEYESNKNSLVHLNSFKKQLIESRQENENLKKQIEFLNLSPAKRRKLEELKSKDSQINTLDKNNIKDGGSF